MRLADTQACQSFPCSPLGQVPKAHVLGLYFRPPNVPWLYYFSAAGEKLSGDDVLRDTYLQTRYTFDPRSNLEYRVARYSLDGSYLGIDNVFNGRLQLCADSSPRLNAAYVFGTTYSQSVRLFIKISLACTEIHLFIEPV